MSQVKNLRAMFENKGDKSTPDRGRSPGASSSTALSAGRLGPSDAGSPRPLSKVRTNFVAIEKDGRIGLRIDRSGESSPSRRPMSTEATMDPTSTSPVTNTDEKRARKVLEKALPTGLPQQPPNTARSSEAIGALPDKSNSNTDKLIDHEQPLADLQPAEPPSTATTGTLRSRAKTPVSWTRRRQTAESHTSKPTATSRATTLSKKTHASGTATARSDGRAAVKLDKTANETLKRDDSKPAKKALEKLGAKRGDGIRAGKATITAASKQRAMLLTLDPRPKPLRGADSEENRLAKPKQKSPTRPANIPASLMASTTSSVVKSRTSREVLSRQSGSLHNLNVPSQPPTRAGSSMASTSSQHSRRPGSALSRPRPSIGPPPCKPIQQDTSAAKRQSQVDEGFLARMMRPTQFSPSKTADKPPTTPPKKTGPWPSTAAADRSARDAGSRKTTATSSRASKKIGPCTSPRSVPSRIGKHATPEPVTSQLTDSNVSKLAVTCSAHEAEEIASPVYTSMEQDCSGIHARHEDARRETCKTIGQPAQEATLGTIRAESREGAATPFLTTTEAAFSETSEAGVENVVRNNVMLQNPRSNPPDKAESPLRCHSADEPPLELYGSTLRENNAMQSEQLIKESIVPQKDSGPPPMTKELPELSSDHSIQTETRATEPLSEATDCPKSPPKNVDEMGIDNGNADSPQDIAKSDQPQIQPQDSSHGAQIKSASNCGTPESRLGKDMASHGRITVADLESANYKGESMA